MFSIHFSLALRQFIGSDSVKAWDYLKVALTWVSTPLWHLHHEPRVKNKKKIRFSDKIFISIYCGVVAVVVFFFLS